MEKVCVKMSEINLSRLINKLVECGVFVDDLKIKNGFAILKIEQDKMLEFEKICRRERKKFVVISKSKTDRILYYIKRMFGLLLASLIIFCYQFSFCGFVYSVNIISEDDAIKRQVELVLKENNCFVGASKRNINLKKIEGIIDENCDGVKGCSVEISGGELTVKIYPSVNKNENLCNEINSKYNAIITKIDIQAGEPKVKVGDAVKDGDLLIKSDTGASGSMLGKVCFVASRIYNEKQTFLKKTGRVLENKVFKIRNKLLYKTQNIITFSNYITEKCVFYILNNYFVPIECEVIRYVEIENNEKVIPFKDVEDVVKNELYNEALASVKDLDTITNVEYSVIEEDGIFKVDCMIECVIDITK